MIEPQTLVSDSELAALMGVSARRVRQLVEIGTLERSERGRFELGPSIRALLEHAAGNGSELQRERTRKVKADADRAELELALRCEELAPIDDFKRVWSARFNLIRVNVMGVAQRAVIRLVGETDEARWKAVMKEELTTALRNAAEAELDLNDEEATSDEQE